MTRLQSRLALHRFVCREFGYDDMDAMLERLQHARGELVSDGESDYAQSLHPHPARALVTPDQFAEYDANIAAHSRRLRMTEEHGRTWKPHQYLALLFTEHYLQRYFADPEALCADLNHEKGSHRPTKFMPDYTVEDLHTLAFQSATGSGKTLLMHAHISQYQHYLDRAGRRLNNIVLVTPNEQMSVQHEREMRESGLRARLFSSEASSDLFTSVEILDLNKLAEKKGVKRVAVADFGDDNLVLVDEGHLGASGKKWRERRQELASGGFAFEYSATFNQIAGKDNDLLNAYGKCLLFDYTYRRFHANGYGKDYAILNLPGGVQDENSDMYLLGCLLTFYQQYRIYRDKGVLWKAFNPAKPLWVFLGKTVTGSSTSKADQATQSDVIRILNFLGWVLAHGEDVRSMIQRLLAGKSGLLNSTGNDCFAGRFSHLPSGEDLYADLCETLFHGAGRLHIVYLTAGEGELHLRTADNDPFGVVNVGDSTKLYNLLTESPNSDCAVDREMGFAARLFADVDRPDSTVNIVIGARRFIAGWNSWRVSTMGLMHVGVDEGPEIIQMFGRGVRLKGYNMSLKRHRESGVELPEDSDELAELEKLYIFGLRANYMQTFRDLLEKEGMRAEQETFSLPFTWNFAKKTDLKLIRLKDDRKYNLSAERPVLPGPNDSNHRVRLDLYSRLQSVGSDGTEFSEETEQNSVNLTAHVAFFNTALIYERLLSRKQQKSWHNLVIEPGTVEQLLQSHDWYELYMPPDRLNATGFKQMRGLENIALDLITEYADNFWRRQRRRWEHDEIEVVALEEDDPNNAVSYELSVDVTEDQLVKDAGELAYNIREGQCDELKEWYEHLKIGVIWSQAHAYQPLLHTRKDRIVTVQPVPLDENEKRVVEQLEELTRKGDPCLQGKELFLIRNLTRGRGVSFFDDFGYYPDFIVWLKDDVHQHVLFLDPKGLSRFGQRERKKVQLHHEIAEIEERVRENDADLYLHAYILSVTPASEIDDGSRSVNEWKTDGVYFLNEADCIQQVIQHALGLSDGETTMQLDPETERRLDLLVSETGRSKAFYRRELTKRSLEDIEDYYLAMAVLERVRQGEEKVHSAAEVRKALGLDD